MKNTLFVVLMDDTRIPVTKYVEVYGYTNTIIANVVYDTYTELGITVKLLQAAKNLGIEFERIEDCQFRVTIDLPSIKGIEKINK